MKKRTVSYATIEPVSSSIIQVDCQEDTKFTATIPVACTHRLLHRIDEPVMFRVFIRGIMRTGGIIAHFTPNWFDLLTITVNETLPDTKHWKGLPSLIFEELCKQVNDRHEICGGKLCVIDTLSHPVDYSGIAFRTASALLIRAMRANWLDGSDYQIGRTLSGYE